MGVADPVGLAGHDRVDDVRNGDDPGAAAARLPDRVERVDRLTGLAHRHDERLGTDDREPVAELARDVGVGVDLPPGLDRLPPDEGSVVARPAAEEEHAAV